MLNYLFTNSEFKVLSRGKKKRLVCFEITQTGQGLKQTLKQKGSEATGLTFNIKFIIYFFM